MYATIAVAGKTDAPTIPAYSGGTMQMIGNNTLIAPRYPFISVLSPVLGDLIGEGEQTTLNEVLALISEKGLDECFYKILECESGFRNICNQEKGCGSGIGLAQIIPSTARNCSKALGRKIDPFNKKDNLECAAYLLLTDGTSHWGTRYTDWGSWSCWNKQCE